MSSNIIPIVSSSPPPFEESPSFEETPSFSKAWDGAKETENVLHVDSMKTSKDLHSDNNIDGDHGNKNNGAIIEANGFGNEEFTDFNSFAEVSTEDTWGDFSDANTTSDNTQLPCEIETNDFSSSKSSKDPHISSEDFSVETTEEIHNDDDGFGDFAEANDKSNKCEDSNSETVSVITSQEKEETITLNEKTAPDKESTKSCLTDTTIKPNAIHKVNDSQDNTSQDSVTDSGLSSDISPIPKSEDDKEYASFQAENIESKTLVIEESQTSEKNDNTSSIQSDDKNSCENDNNKSLPEDSQETNEIDVQTSETQNGDNAEDIQGTNEIDVEISETENRENAGDIQGTNEIDVEISETQNGDNAEDIQGTNEMDVETSETQNGDNDEEFSFNTSGEEPEFLNLKPSSFPDNEGSDFLNQHGDEYGQFEDFVKVDAEEKVEATAVNIEKNEDSEEKVTKVNEEQIDSSLHTIDDGDKDSIESNSIKNIPDPKPSASNLHSEEVNLPEKENIDDSCKEKVCHSNTENKSEDDDFGDFGGAQIAGDTDFDDFGDFGEAQPVGENTDFGAFSDSQNTGGDDWAAFGSGTSGDAFPDTAQAAPESGGDWASFQEPQLTVKASEEEDDDFGEFEDTPNDFQTLESSGSLQVLEKDAATIVTKCFPEKEVNGNDTDSDQLLEIMEKEKQRREEMLIKQPGRMPVTKSTSYDVSVWNNLKDLENTNALKYQWNKSNNSQQLLQAIAVDTRNILMGHKKQAVPIFATDLGLLEPSKSSLVEPRRPMTITSQKAGEQLIQDTQKQQGTVMVPISGMVNTPDIPPVEFDWSSSGLTNPLDSANLQLDLDFFTKKDSKTNNIISPTSALETEFLKEIEPSRIEAIRQLQPLENLLANMNFTPTAPQNKTRQQSEEKLSSESQNIMKSFPNISFMRAKVLMFPLKGNIDQDRDP